MSVGVLLNNLGEGGKSVTWLNDLTLSEFGPIGLGEEGCFPRCIPV